MYIYIYIYTYIYICIYTFQKRYTSKYPRIFGNSIAFENILVLKNKKIKIKINVSISFMKLNCL